MNKVSLELIKELRQMTNVGLDQCKKALIASNGDLEEAVDYLRKAGIASSIKRSDRDASEGVVCIKYNNTRAVMISLHCETDFVSRNDQFTILAEKIANSLLDSNISNINDLIIENIPLTEYLLAQSAFGEKINLQHATIWNINNHEKIAYYVHDKSNTSLVVGRQGVLVKVNTSMDDTIAKHIAMHIAVANPISIDRNNISQDFINRERTIIAEKAIGKPLAIQDKIINGGLENVFKKVVLLEQIFVLDDNQTLTINEYIQDNKILAFVMFKIK